MKTIKHGITAGAVALLVGVAPAGAADSASLDKTVALINSMVEHGALTRDRAEVMIGDARRQAATAVALNQPSGAGEAAASAPVSGAAMAATREQIRREILAEMKAQLSEDVKRQVLTELLGGGGAAAVTRGGSGSAQVAVEAPAGTAGTAGVADGAKPRVVRVPYVPESMRRELREQVKKEVLAQAKEERWGNPDTLPEWLDRFQFEGDARLRYDLYKLGKDNTPPGVANYVSGTGLTRGADLVGANGNISGAPAGNTQDDFDRTRLRLRLGVIARVADSVTAGLRISTGNTTGPTSTNQTLGQGLNKYALVLDRGYVTLAPWKGFSFSGGRIANPFFSTDLVWAEDLNFEGFAASYNRNFSPDINGFLTAGWFPLRSDNPLQATSRDLKGIQAGFNWQLGNTTAFKLGTAYYAYRGIEGQLESDVRFGPPSAADYGTLYEYPNGLRQRGNTLFVVNALADPLSGPTYWGLASGFRELNITGTLDIGRFAPWHVTLTGDYVKNLAFDRSSIAARTGSVITDGKGYGYMGRVVVGYPTISRRGEWNASLAYRWLGSDAVLDAYTNSDFGMGGTNNKGYVVGGSYGIEKNTWLSVRWMAAQLIDSMAPQVAGSTATSTKLSSDLWQIDLNTRF